MIPVVMSGGSGTRLWPLLFWGQQDWSRMLNLGAVVMDVKGVIAQEDIEACQATYWRL